MTTRNLVRGRAKDAEGPTVNSELTALQELAVELTEFVVPEKFTVADGLLCWLDADGNPMERYGCTMVRALERLDHEGRQAFVVYASGSRDRTWRLGFDAGYREGKAEITRVAHELLGVDKIVRALRSIG